MKETSKSEEGSFDFIESSIIEILESDTQEFIFLTGAAGTGKSTMLEHIRNILDLSEFNIYSIIII